MIPITLPNADEHRKLIAKELNQAMEGKLRCIGQFTLAPSATTTVVDDRRAGDSSIILWMPLTATAAAAMDNLWVSLRDKQAFTLTHDSNAAVDRTFGYAVIG